ncbi:hypothetical protein J6590_011249 [Homalodisca vitripennis]|nr:hypothetical protein J6590_011249 [Homalodisca vitripennis]
MAIPNTTPGGDARLKRRAQVAVRHEHNGRAGGSLQSATRPGSPSIHNVSRLQESDRLTVFQCSGQTGD